jgi:carboxylesterase type B
MDITSFQQANLPDPFPEPGVNGDPIWAYNPCLDGVFIQDYSVKQLHEGRFVVIPTMFGSNTNEGTIFADQSDETTVDLQSFLMRQFPMLTNNMLETYAELYDFNLNSTLQPYWYNEAAAYGETRYICSSMYSSTAFNNGSTSNHWVYHFDQNDPTFGDLLVLHGAELGAVWGMGGPPGFYSQNAYIVSLVQDYWASFIQTFNPNTKKLASAPVWDSWDAQKLNRMHLIARQPGMEILDAGTRDRCQWLESIAVDIRQ